MLDYRLENLYNLALPIFPSSLSTGPFHKPCSGFFLLQTHHSKLHAFLPTSLSKECSFGSSHSPRPSSQVTSSGKPSVIAPVSLGTDEKCYLWCISRILYSIPDPLMQLLVTSQESCTFLSGSGIYSAPEGSCTEWMSAVNVG